MERSILVPLDGTPAAMAALPHALGLAARFGAELCLVTVCDPSELPLDATGKRWDFLHAMGARLGARTRILSGNPAQEIVREASFLEPELIVMGTRAEAAPRTVAEAVMRGAHCPVLIVPDPGAHEAERRLEGALAGDYPRYRRITLPLDGTPSAAMSLGPACHLALRDGGELTMVRVLDCDAPHVNFDDAHRAYLEERADDLRARGCCVETRYCHSRFAPCVAGLEQDLVVLSAREHPLVGGANIIDVVHGARCPVLVVRGQRQPMLGLALPETIKTRR